MDQCFFWQLCWKFCFRRFCFSFGGVGFSVAAVSTCALCFFSLTNYIWPEKNTVAECPRNWSKMFMIVHTTHVSSSSESWHCLRLSTASIVSILCRWALSRSVSFLLGFWTCWRWYYSIKYTSFTGHLTRIGFTPVGNYSASDGFLSREIWVHSVS